ncbi:la-related protein 6B-like [Cucurbita maxima]|uniref:La-related protein 6B-like n=1 Tax=Cucurbita maxima TaxID=3661 RepID=A0A6J1I059_CUCMA|nr:la-related protein 6B-like [Cucurbita maxima]
MAHHSSSSPSPSPSPSPPLPSQSDPSLSRNSSLSRLNAQAPEFVPTRSSPRPDLQPPQSSSGSQPPPPPSKQSPRILIPSPPPPPAVMHVYPPPPPGSPFHVPIQSPVPVPVPVPTHVVSIPNHHYHPHHRHHHHHSHHVPVLYHPHNPQYYADNGGFHDPDNVVQQPQKPPVESDYGAPSRTKLTGEVSQKLLNQVEYYFSDLNLATTDHLMRFINKDPDGYVPISVVASFKKIKALINSHSQLANILRNSSKLMVSEDGKKVRRKQPLSESDMEELQSRIVIAENLPDDHCHQNLMKIFSAVGSVKNIRTCQPQISDSGTSSTSKSAKTDGMHYSNKLHAFVEYESVVLAEKAVAELNDEGNWRNALRLRLMLTCTSKSTPPRGKKGHNGEMNCKDDDTSEQPHIEKHVDDLSDQADVHPHEQREEQGNEKDGGGQRRVRNRVRGKGRGRSQYHHNHNNNHGNHVGTPPSSSSSSIEQAGTVKQQPPGPRMPDGTRGFSMGRGKPVSVNMA